MLCNSTSWSLRSGECTQTLPLPRGRQEGILHLQSKEQELSVKTGAQFIN